MSGGKGGSSPSTAGMEKVAREANALQQRMYEEGVQRAQPYYDVGVSGLGTLADYLGLSGGSQRSEAQIRESLLPQYTTTQTTGGMANGQSMPKWSDYLNRLNMSERGGAQEQALREQYNNDMAGIMAQGYTNPVTKDVVDYAGLNSAVQSQLAAQGADKPDYYGSLLTPFSMEQFEADPSYAFRQEEGNKALERQLAAGGKSFTPEAAKALQGYNQNLASQEYMNAYNRYNTDQSNIYNRLANIAGVGQTTAQQLTGLGQQYAQNVGQTNASVAQAQFDAQQAAQQNRSSMFGNLGSLAGMGIGFATGGPAGAYWGGQIGGAAGGLF